MNSKCDAIFLFAIVSMHFFCCCTFQTVIGVLCSEGKHIGCARAAAAAAAAMLLFLFFRLIHIGVVVVVVAAVLRFLSFFSLKFNAIVIAIAVVLRFICLSFVIPGRTSFSFFHLSLPFASLALHGYFCAIRDDDSESNRISTCL